MPVLIKVHEKYAAQGLKVIAVNWISQDQLSEVQRVMDRFKMPFPVLLDEDGFAGMEYGTGSNPPVNVLLDAEGRVVYMSRLVPVEKVKRLMDQS